MFDSLSNRLQDVFQTLRGETRLTPENVRQGMFTAQAAGGWELTHGDPHYPLIQFRAPDDFTGINDEREVWWCKSKSSEIDGQPGSYYYFDNGHRYDEGQWPSGDPQLFDKPCP